MSYNISVIVAKGTKPTARLLAAELASLAGEAVPLQTSFVSGSIGVNWGRGSIPSAGYGCKIINAPYAVMAANSKGTALRAFRSSGIDTPETGRLEHRNWDFTMSSFPLLLRAESHTRGKDITVAYTFKEFMDAVNSKQFSHWTKLINGGNEYRVHVVLGQVFIQKKFLPPENVDASNPLQNIVKNHGNGWRFARRSPTAYASYRDMSEAATQAVSGLGLHFGAVDIIRANGVSYVLEVNTAPALTEQGFLRDYANALFEHIRGYRERHNAGTIIRTEGYIWPEGSASVWPEADQDNL